MFCCWRQRPHPYYTRNLGCSPWTRSLMSGLRGAKANYPCKQFRSGADYMTIWPQITKSSSSSSHFICQYTVTKKWQQNKVTDTGRRTDNLASQYRAMHIAHGAVINRPLGITTSCWFTAADSHAKLTALIDSCRYREQAYHWSLDAGQSARSHIF